MKDVAVAFSIGVSVLVSVLAFVPAHSLEDMVVLQDSAFKHRQRPAAVFVHEQHNEKAELDECSVCHHVYEDGKKVDDESSEDKRMEKKWMMNQVKIRDVQTATRSKVVIRQDL